jgi:hypothetical protein
MVTERDLRKEPGNRTPLTGRLTVTTGRCYASDVTTRTKKRNTAAIASIGSVHVFEG